MGLKNVSFLDSVPKSEVPRYWALLDVSIIHLRRTGLFTSVIPSRLFEYMAMGIPAVHGVAGESADIVQREGIGTVSEPEDEQGLYQALCQFRENSDVYESAWKTAPRPPTAMTETT